MEKETLKAIAEIDAKVAAAEEGVVTLKQQRGDLYRTLRERILYGGTTGDDIRDLVIQATGSDNAELESKYRKLNERLKGHAGEFILFTFSTVVCTKHVFMPSPGNENAYEEVWYTAVGILKENALRLNAHEIEFDIDQYAVASGDMPFHLEFKAMKSLRTGYRYVHLQFDRYAEASAEYRRNPKLCIGDEAVRTWFDAGGKDGKKLFDTCCVLLSKLVLQPTEDG